MVDNVQFITTKFENFFPESKFDIVLSFANHSTYDGETDHSLEEYFSKVKNLINSNGFMIFIITPSEYRKRLLQS